ncbi:LPS assembly lipoprotein LptE [Magnetospirillum sulfuroxidans]|uniref:LPS-assembly lipoprotein n=1 Tax=Magnetospirillum sulfuroxidans TaxID=611300 RepID=A0ABS5IEB6_9PROT|nr:LPS assembly lipoprotein LptE [Magnetospirillum sulfuroxidans]MBR9972767.1 hypothetical protein [Magnetospirillum sulfuroxidans]
MWWSKVALMVGLLALGPMGCGFTPMYAKNQSQANPVVAELAGIRVAGIEDRSGQILRNALVQRITPLGEPAHSTHSLNVKLTTSQENLAERNDGKASLGRLFITATFQLVDYQSEKPVFSSSSRSVVSYRLLGPRYGSTAVERDAEQRALTDLAEDIRAQVAAYFANGKRPSGTIP